MSRRALVPVLLAALAMSCAPYQVHTDYDQEVTFDSFRTFAWMDSARSREDNSANPFLERRVKRAVELVMQERGLTEVQPDRADLLVTAFVIGPTRDDERRARWATIGCGPSVSIWLGSRGYPYGFGRRRSPWGYMSPWWGSPWGYACSYRIGFGYMWLPLYGSPGPHLAGTLVIDVLDRQERELVWRGSADGALIDPRRSDQSQEEIERIVREVLKQFPPK